jgi:RP/EB family microtubule-associated protein
MTRSADNVVGMMDSAYFVSRTELLSFLNELLDLNLKKIEHTAPGHVACLLTEYIFPGSIPLKRINWEARSDYEFVSNYKLLQAAFTKHNVKRYVDVNKLIRAKYQDNLEFCQWLKAFYDQSGVYHEEYDGRAIRAKGKGGKKFNDSMDKVTATSKGRSSAKSFNKETMTKRNSTYPVSSRASNNRSQPRPIPLKASENKDRPSTTTSGVENDKLKNCNIELENRILELEGSVGDIEKERDFYFGKLRSIELFLQIKQDKHFENCDKEDIVSNLFRVLYATVDDDVQVGDDGEVVPISQGETGNVSKSDISADLSDALGSTASQHIGITSFE